MTGIGFLILQHRGAEKCLEVKIKSSLNYIPTSILANLVGSYVYLPGMAETAF